MSPGSGPVLVLASASPRRAGILDSLGLGYRTRPARIPEERRPGERPEEYAERLARQKAVAVAAGEPEALVVGGDTVVILGDAVLEQPEDADAALEMLRSLSGRSHRVATGVAVVEPGGAVHSGVRSARVHFRDFDDEEARAYVATGEPLDKAGGYGIQGKGAALVTGIEGDYSAVVGLSVSLLVELLARAGHPYDYGVAKEREEDGEGRR